MYNLTQLIGRLTTEPEITKTETGKKVCNITLAVQRNFKNSNGIYEADFIRCVLWDGIASKVCEYCHKGDLVTVCGQLRTSNYMSNDQKKQKIELVVEKLLFLSTKKDNTLAEISDK